MTLLKLVLMLVWLEFMVLHATLMQFVLLKSSLTEEPQMKLVLKKGASVAVIALKEE